MRRVSSASTTTTTMMSINNIACSCPPTYSATYESYANLPAYGRGNRKSNRHLHNSKIIRNELAISCKIENRIEIYVNYIFESDWNSNVVSAMLCDFCVRLGCLIGNNLTKLHHDELYTPKGHVEFGLCPTTIRQQQHELPHNLAIVLFVFVRQVIVLGVDCRCVWRPRAI